MADLFREIGEFTPDKLIASNKFPLTAKGITLAAGQGILKRGALLGQDGSGTYALLDGTAITTPDCILTDTADTAAAVITSGYITGIFNRDAVIEASSADITDIGAHENDLRKLGIFLRAVQEY
jgi:hypothetical protein